MKRFFALAAVLGCTYFADLSVAHATEVGNGRDFGLGFALGRPTSLVGKAFLGGDNALDFGLGFSSFGSNCWHDRGARYCDSNWRFNHITMNVDYLWQDEIVRGSGAKLDWHIGVGGRVWIYSDGWNDGFALAGRMPVGLDLTFPKPSFLEVFFELAPALYVFPGVGLDIEAQLGVRFYF
jgi:hypothetical protein